MTNHPNRNKRDTHQIVVDMALAALLRHHTQYHNTDAAGRRNIRRNIGDRLYELYSGHTPEQLIADYKSAFER